MVIVQYFYSSWNGSLLGSGNSQESFPYRSHGGFVTGNQVGLRSHDRHNLDPRWGRIAEGCGEDPYLASVLAKAMVEGFQGDSLTDPSSIAACAKHYCGYGFSEGGRDYNTTYITEPVLRNVVLKPFKAAKDAGALTFMSAFNDLNGVPASGNEFTLKEILRKEWNLTGL